MKILVIGGGISGLASAFFLKERYPHVAIELSERRKRLGGQLYTYDGVDIGAEAFVVRRSEAVELIEKLGLDHLICYPDENYSPRILCNGVLLPIPQRSFMGIPVDKNTLYPYLSSPEKLDFETKTSQELVWQLGDDMTVSDYVTHFFTPAVIEKVIDPFIGGVYAASSDRISLRYAMPAIAAQLDAGIKDNADIIAAIIPEHDSHAVQPVFAALKGGYEVLVKALVKAIHCDRRPQTLSLSTEANGYRAYYSDGTSSYYDAVIIATTPGPAADILHNCASEASAILRAIPTSSPVVVQLRATCDFPGYTGILIPENTENIAAKAITFSAQKWPHLCDTQAVRISYGRYDSSLTEEIAIDDTWYTQHAVQDFSILTGIMPINPTIKVQYWKQTLPVINPDNYQRLRMLTELLPSNIALTGAYLAGVGVPSCIGGAQQVVAAMEL